MLSTDLGRSISNHVGVVLVDQVIVRPSSLCGSRDLTLAFAARCRYDGRHVSRDDTPRAVCVRLKAGEPFVGSRASPTRPRSRPRRSARRPSTCNFSLSRRAAGQGAQARTARDGDLCDQRRGRHVVRRKLEQHMVTQAGDFVYIPPTCRICPITAARQNPPSRSSRAPIPTSRKASSCCRSSTRSIRKDVGEARMSVTERRAFGFPVFGRRAINICKK